MKGTICLLINVLHMFAEYVTLMQNLVIRRCDQHVGRFDESSTGRGYEVFSPTSNPRVQGIGLSAVVFGKRSNSTTN